MYWVVTLVVALVLLVALATVLRYLARPKICYYHFAPSSHEHQFVIRSFERTDLDQRYVFELHMPGGIEQASAFGGPWVESLETRDEGDPPHDLRLVCSGLPGEGVVVLAATSIDPGQGGNAILRLGEGSPRVRGFVRASAGNPPSFFTTLGQMWSVALVVGLSAYWSGAALLDWLAGPTRSAGRGLGPDLVASAALAAVAVLFGLFIVPLARREMTWGYLGWQGTGRDWKRPQHRPAAQSGEPPPSLKRLLEKGFTDPGQLKAVFEGLAAKHTACPCFEHVVTVVAWSEGMGPVAQQVVSELIAKGCLADSGEEDHACADFLRHALVAEITPRKRSIERAFTERRWL